MADFVNLDLRAAGWPMARPAVPVNPAVGVWPAAQASGQSPAREQPALQASQPTRARAGASSPQNASSTQTGTSGQSAPFTAQRLAQETETAAERQPLRSAAMMAYLKTRDSHIQILRSIQTLDLRV